MVRGYHEHKCLWTDPFDGEELICEREVGNPSNPQVVAVKTEIEPRAIYKLWATLYTQTAARLCMATLFILYRGCTLEVLQNRHCMHGVFQ